MAKLRAMSAPSLIVYGRRRLLREESFLECITRSLSGVSLHAAGSGKASTEQVLGHIVISSRGNTIDASSWANSPWSAQWVGQIS